MITWPSLSLPALNLLNYPSWLNYANIPKMGTNVPKIGMFEESVTSIHGLKITFIRRKDDL